MKISTVRKLATVATVAAIAVSVGLSPSGTTSAADESKEVYLDFVPKGVSSWYEVVRAGVEAAKAELAEMGVTVKYDWDPPQQFDVTQWAAALEAAAAKKPDVLVPSCLDPAAGTPIINQAIENGTTVFTFDNDCPDSNRIAFIGHPENTADGAALADNLAAAIGGKGKVAVLIGSASSLQHQQRVQGFVDRMTANYPDVEIVAQEADNDDLQQAADVAATILQAHPDLVGFYGADSVAPEGAVKAIREANKVGQVFVVGQDDEPDTVQGMRDGIVSGFYLQHQYDMGYWAVYYAWALKNGRSIPALHETGGYVVTPDQVDTYKSATAPVADSVYLDIVPKGVSSWYEVVRGGLDDAKAELAEMGVTVKYDWDPPQQFDVTQWAAALEAAAAKKPDVLVPSCLDPAAGTPIINQAIENGTTVFTFDNDCPDSNRIAFIGHPENTADGAALADNLAAAIGGKGKVAVLIGSASSLQHQQRVQGFVDRMTANYPDVEIVAQEADNDDLQQAADVAATILQAHPDLVGFYGADSVAPEGAVKAIREANKVGQVFVVGQDDEPDTVQGMRDGIVSGFYLQHQANMGYWAAYYAWALQNGHTIPAVHETGGYVVTPDMLDALYPAK